MHPDIAALKIDIESDPHNIELARSLLKTIVNTIDAVEMDSATIDVLLQYNCETRRNFDADEGLAYSHMMALASAAKPPETREEEQRNEDLLKELRNIKDSIHWNEYDASGFDICIMGNQYCGLLKQRRYHDADLLFADMSERGFEGSQRERLEWLIAVRHGFWIVLEDGDTDRIERQIELVRKFRRLHRVDNYEAPHALLGMLLPAFESAERHGDLGTANCRVGIWATSLGRSGWPRSGS